MFFFSSHSIHIIRNLLMRHIPFFSFHNFFISLLRCILIFLVTLFLFFYFFYSLLIFYKILSPPLSLSLSLSPSLSSSVCFYNLLFFHTRVLKVLTYCFYLFLRNIMNMFFPPSSWCFLCCFKKLIYFHSFKIISILMNFSLSSLIRAENVQKYL